MHTTCNTISLSLVKLNIKTAKIQIGPIVVHPLVISGPLTAVSSSYLICWLTIWYRVLFRYVYNCENMIFIFYGGLMHVCWPDLFPKLGHCVLYLDLCLVCFGLPAVRLCWSRRWSRRCLHYTEHHSTTSWTPISCADSARHSCHYWARWCSNCCILQAHCLLPISIDLQNHGQYLQSRSHNVSKLKPETIIQYAIIERHIEYGHTDKVSHTTSRKGASCRAVLFMIDISTTQLSIKKKNWRPTHLNYRGYNYHTTFNTHQIITKLFIFRLKHIYIYIDLFKQWYVNFNNRRGNIYKCW